MTIVADCIGACVLAHGMSGHLTVMTSDTSFKQLATTFSDRRQLQLRCLRDKEFAFGVLARTSAGFPTLSTTALVPCGPCTTTNSTTQAQ